LVVGDVATAGNGPYKAPKAVKTGEVFWAVNTAAGGAAGAVVVNGASVSVRNSQGLDGHTSTAVVTGSTLSVNLPATATIVDNSDFINVAPTGTFVSKTSFTVTNGVITGVVLS
jgi:hypothetical protein